MGWSDNRGNWSKKGSGRKSPGLTKSLKSTYELRAKASRFSREQRSEQSRIGEGSQKEVENDFETTHNAGRWNFYAQYVMVKLVQKDGKNEKELVAELGTFQIA